MLRYLSDIQLSHPGYRVHQCLVYIGSERLAMAAGLDSPQLRYRYEMLDMRDIGYRTLYDSQSPDALVLAILGDFGGDDPQDVVVRLLVKLRALAGQDEGRLREYLQMLEVLADNRHLGVNIQEAYDMLQIDIERLPSYQKGMEKGERLKALQVARELVALNFSPEQIAAITKLPLVEIAKLEK